MRIALVHNSYLQRGGEDVVVEHELELLRQQGHQVECYFTSNSQLLRVGQWKQLLFSLWNGRERRLFRQWLRQKKCDIVHVHNTFAYLSPAILAVPHQLGIPLVVTLHNYRLVCPAGILFRAGNICHLCLQHRSLLPGLRHRCYRGSFKHSAVVVANLQLHRWLASWSRHVDLFFVFGARQQQLLLAAGLPVAKLQIKANSVPWRAKRQLPASFAELKFDFLLLGRISVEKGSLPLLRWWAEHRPPAKLTVVGGCAPELLSEFEKLVADCDLINYTGSVGHSEVASILAGSRFLIFPSIWYEGMPMVLLEACCHGVPVLARRLGAAAECVSAGKSGFFFSNDAELGEQIGRLMQLDFEVYCQLIDSCYQHFCHSFSPEVNLNALEQCYRRLVAEFSR